MSSQSTRRPSNRLCCVNPIIPARPRPAHDPPRQVHCILGCCQSRCRPCERRCKMSSLGRGGGHYYIIIMDNDHNDNDDHQHHLHQSPPPPPPPLAFEYGLRGVPPMSVCTLFCARYELLHEHRGGSGYRASSNATHMALPTKSVPWRPHWEVFSPQDEQLRGRCRRCCVRFHPVKKKTSGKMARRKVLPEIR